MTTYEIIAIILSAVSLIMSIIIITTLKSSSRNKDKDQRDISIAIERASAALEQKLINEIKTGSEALRSAVLEDNRGTRNELYQHNQSLVRQINDGIAASDKAQRENLHNLTESTANRLDEIRRGVTQSINQMNDSNQKSLQSMQETVDEKLSATINKRFNESFTAISDRLDAVNKGLGEMNTLAQGVGDLKNVLSNVKIRGGWGEMQLGALLEQILSPTQYRANVKVKPRSGEIVEYAIVLPGKEDDKEIFLPIDSKFPIESYQRYVHARDNGDTVATEQNAKSLVAEIKHNARTIRDKYIAPPYTTDFAIMYLPTEGLYSFAASDVGLLETLQREMRITIMGPTTLGAFLNSLQMGFRTLEIQKKTSLVWKAVAGIKKEFGTFGTLLEKTQKKIDGARDDIYQAVDRTRKIQDKLNRLEAPKDAEQELIDVTEQDQLEQI